MSKSSNSPELKVLCIGDIFLDILPSTFPIAKEKILQDGETFVHSITFQRGGCAGNFVAVLKSSAPDITVDFVSRIGGDANGDFLLQEMAKYGVNAKFIKDPSELSAITIAISFKDGERHFITNLGALEHFSIKDINEQMFSGVSHLAYRGIWFMALLLESCTEFLKIAKSKGISISMDLGFDPFWNQLEENPSLLPQINARKTAALNALQYITYLFGNQKELLHLTDSTTLDAAIKFILSKGVKYVVLHRGSDGAAIISKKDSNSYDFIPIPVAKVEVKNPVGSGDTFDSLFIAQTLTGKSPVQAAAFAACGAALSLQSPAGTKITAENIIKFLNSHPELLQLYSK
jgi:sugar/nucleoside kinase (ribokinase family)